LLYIGRLRERLVQKSPSESPRTAPESGEHIPSSPGLAPALVQETEETLQSLQDSIKDWSENVALLEDNEAERNGGYDDDYDQQSQERYNDDYDDRDEDRYENDRDYQARQQQHRPVARGNTRRQTGNGNGRSYPQSSSRDPRQRDQRDQRDLESEPLEYSMEINDEENYSDDTYTYSKRASRRGSQSSLYDLAYDEGPERQYRDERDDRYISRADEPRSAPPRRRNQRQTQQRQRTQQPQGRGQRSVRSERSDRQSGSEGEDSARLTDWDDGISQAEEYNPEDPRHSSRNSRGARTVKAAQYTPQNKHRVPPGRRRVLTAYEIRHRSQMELHAANEAAKYTFKPKISPLPSFYPARTQDEDFLKRTEKWLSRKHKNKKFLKDLYTGLSDCTFKPKMNETSKELASVAKLGQSKPIHDRLNTIERDTRVIAQELEIKRDRERKFRKDCTFKPKISETSKAIVKRMVRNEGYQQAKSQSTAVPTELLECTFTPKVNELPPGMEAAMLYLSQDPFQRLASAVPADVIEEPASDDSGQLWGGNVSIVDRELAVKHQAMWCKLRSKLKAAAYTVEGVNWNKLFSVYDRDNSGTLDYNEFRSAIRRDAKLSANVFSEKAMQKLFRLIDDDDSGYIGIDEFVTWIETYDEQTPNKMQFDIKPRSLSSKQSPLSKQSFNNFLRRQEELLERKGRTILEGQRDVLDDAPFAPQLNDTSRYIAHRMTADLTGKERSGFNNFLARQQVNDKKLRERAIQSRRNAMDEECTFHPEINYVSKIRPGRSNRDRSLGDAAKRQARVNAVAHETLRAELDELTHKPKVRNTVYATEGVLKLTSDRDSYTERVQARNNAKEHQRLQAIQDREEEEMRNCSFKPKTKDAPEFVKQIAKSVRLAKAQQPPKTPPKADWR